MEKKDEVKKRKMSITHAGHPSKLKKRLEARESLEKITKKYGRVLKHLANYK